jgi:hypothetical protein
MGLEGKERREGLMRDEGGEREEGLEGGSPGTWGFRDEGRRLRYRESQNTTYEFQYFTRGSLGVKSEGNQNLGR